MVLRHDLKFPNYLSKNKINLIRTNFTFNNVFVADPENIIQQNDKMTASKMVFKSFERLEW